MSNLIDLTDQVFDRLTVLLRADNNRRNEVCWNCLCDCGNVKIVVAYDLRRGNTKSCGCLNRERSTTHGLANHPLYSVWSGMNNRCNNPKEESYHNYGGRGIAVCDRWHRDNPEGLKNFIDDMYPTYKVGLTLDRIDNNLGYSPKNCKWSTMKEQSNNKRNNRLFY